MLEFNKMIFDGWDVLLRTILIGLMAYISVIVILRASGKRALSQLNAFDFVVTVAIGSVLASIIINKNVTITQGITAFLILMLMQYIITKLSVHSKTVSKYIKASPTLLFHNGEFQDENMKKERLVKNEIKQAIRSNGIGDLNEVKAVIIETNGKLSIITKKSSEDTISLDDPLFNEIKK